MKHLLTLMVLLFCLQSFAQIDHQWYVKENFYMSTPLNWSSGPVNSTDFYILGVDHPFRPSTLTPLNEIPELPRNDLFIIYDNGYHYNSKEKANDEWINWVSPNGGSNYHVKTYDNISHLYYTNVYEGDDVEPGATLSDSPPPGPPLLTFSQIPTTPGFPSSTLVRTTPSSGITVNHTAVAGRDITLIIDHNQIVIDSTCQYDLCFQLTDIRNGGNLINNPQQYISVSNVFSDPFLSFIANGAGLPLASQSETLNDSCISGLIFNNDAKYTYVNFHIDEDADNILSNCQLDFILDGGINCDSVAHRDTIKNSHDPNFVRVNCVNKGVGNATSSYIHYTAQCMNDGYDDQDNPSIELTFPFPFSITPAEISVTAAKIRTCQTCNTFNTQDPQVLPTTSPNRIEFKFTGNLKNCEIPHEEEECIAWVDFCVKVPSTYDVTTQPLEPINRNTMFGDDPYVIERYIPLECDSVFVVSTSNGEVLTSNSPNFEGQLVNGVYLDSNDQQIEGTWECHIQSSPNCCSPCSPFSFCCNGNYNWPMIIGAILALILLLLMLQKFFGKKSKG